MTKFVFIHSTIIEKLKLIEIDKNEEKKCLISSCTCHPDDKIRKI